MNAHTNNLFIEGHKPKAPSILEGTVTDFQYGNYRIDCGHAHKDHLKVHFLSQNLINPHKVEIGDKVRLEYRSGPGYGLWFVAEVLS